MMVSLQWLTCQWKENKTVLNIYNFPKKSSCCHGDVDAFQLKKQELYIVTTIIDKWQMDGAW